MSEQIMEGPGGENGPSNSLKSAHSTAVAPRYR